MEFPKLAVKNRWLSRGIPVVLGGAAGFAYYTFIGCASGGCPIPSNPWISTAYGGLIGFVATGGLGRSKKSEVQGSSTKGA